MVRGWLWQATGIEGKVRLCYVAGSRRLVSVSFLGGEPLIGILNTMCHIHKHD